MTKKQKSGNNRTSKTAPAAGKDRELSDEDLDRVAGGGGVEPLTAKRTGARDAKRKRSD